MPAPGPTTLTVMTETLALREPFRMTGHILMGVDVVVATLQQGEHTGRGEASGVFYRAGEDAPGMVNKIESVRGSIERGIDRQGLQHLLPPGGARNALDCALWDLEAKVARRAAWQIAELDPPRPLLSTFTVSAGTPEKMAADAIAYTGARALKLKLTGDAADAARVRAVRAACPAIWLAIDANQGFTRPTFEALVPVLLECQVELIEQPFIVGEEPLLTELKSPIQIAADESVQELADLWRSFGRFDVVNIKLDKCGGLTEAFSMAREAKRLGLKVMVGNTIGTSLAMAPAFLVGQLCQIVDLDGPIFLKADHPNPLCYADGYVTCPEALWGYA